MELSFHCTPGGLAFACLFCLATDDVTFAAALIAIAVHELGHLGAMALTGVRGGAVTLELFGLSIRCGAAGFRQERIVALAGPLLGAVLTAVCLLLHRALPFDALFLTAGISAALTVFNLLPVRPLDGQRFLAALLAERSIDGAAGAADAVSAAVAAALFAASAVLFVHTGAWTVLAASSALLIRNVPAVRPLQSAGK